MRGTRPIVLIGMTAFVSGTLATTSLAGREGQAPIAVVLRIHLSSAMPNRVVDRTLRCDIGSQSCKRFARSRAWLLEPQEPDAPSCGPVGQWQGSVEGSVGVRHIHLVLWPPACSPDHGARLRIWLAIAT
jgi:hypothetical protein